MIQAILRNNKQAATVYVDHTYCYIYVDGQEPMTFEDIDVALDTWRELGLDDSENTMIFAPSIVYDV